MTEAGSSQAEPVETGTALGTDDGSSTNSDMPLSPGLDLIRIAMLRDSEQALNHEQVSAQSMGLKIWSDL